MHLCLEVEGFNSMALFYFWADLRIMNSCQKIKQGKIRKLMQYNYVYCIPSVRAPKYFSDNKIFIVRPNRGGIAEGALQCPAYVPGQAFFTLGQDEFLKTLTSKF